MPDCSLKFKSIDFSSTSKRCIVALHGFTGSYKSFIPIAKRLNLKDTRWYFVQGPYRISANKWSWHYKENEEWIMGSSKKKILSFLEEFVFIDFDPSDVYIIGFSQGATVIYNACLGIEQPLGGLFPISGYSSKVHEKLHENQKHTKILIGHGKNDDIVPLSESININNYLQEHSTNTELYLYNGKHKISFKYLNKFSLIVSDG